MSFSEDSLYTFVKPVVYIDIQSDIKYTEDILRILTLEQWVYTYFSTLTGVIDYTPLLDNYHHQYL